MRWPNNWHPQALGQVPAGVLGLLAPDDHVHEVGVGALLALGW